MDQENGGHRLGTDSEVTRAHAGLRSMIMNLQLAPGQKISQLELSRQLGVGRTPLREAIRLLQNEGLIVSERNQRPVVTPFDPDKLDALYAVRIMTGCLALRLSARELSTSDLAELRAAASESRRALEAGNAAAYDEPHRRFHDIIEGGAGAIHGYLQKWNDNAEIYRRMYINAEPNAPLTAADEHDAIVSALDSGDVDSAVQHLAMHWGRTSLRVMLHFAPTFEPQATRGAMRLVANGKVGP